MNFEMYSRFEEEQKDPLDVMPDEDFQLFVPDQPVPKTDKIGLIDADFVKYVVTYAISKDMENKVANLRDPVVKYTDRYVTNILSAFDAPAVIFCFSGARSRIYRNSVAFERKYKGNREGTERYKDQVQDQFRVIEYLSDRYPTLFFPDLEADDILSMLQDDDTFIYTQDKDLLQVPGTHFDLKKDVFFEVSKAEALEFIMHQMITGDSVDNIPGLKGSGKEGSADLLTNIPVKNMPQKVLLEYCKKFGFIHGIDQFVEAWNLLKLRVNRGEAFRAKYAHAFDTLQDVKHSIKNLNNNH